MLNKSSQNFEKHSRLFKRGDMKYIILDLIKSKPAHGYEITQELEERFHGLYSPSTGSVYPVLQLLEDMGLVSSSVMEGKKIYTVTDTGSKFLEDQKETTERIKGRLWGWRDSDNGEYLQDVRETIQYVHDIQHVIRHIAVREDPAKIARVNEILVSTLKDIERIYQKK